MQSSLSLLLLGRCLFSGTLFFGNSTSAWFVLFGNGHSLSILGELVEHVSALSTGVSVWVISHISTYKRL